MFKLYGIIGILLILLTEINFIFKIQPFANWYFPLIWWGYILTIDAIIFKLKRDSLISNRFQQFLGMTIFSIFIWWAFEVINISVGNWKYVSFSEMSPLASMIMKNLAFATVVPAFFETVELLRTIHLFDKKKLKKKHNITKKTIYILITLGVLAFLSPLVLPKFTYPLVWLSFFLILDPINYLHKQPSIIKHLRDKKLVIPLSLLVAIMIMGFLWEFWNYWAVRKWVYDIPYFGFFKIFEMPILGYLGYLPFAFELYAMYWFLRSLVIHKEHLLYE